MNIPLVTVLMPVYNAEKYLQEAVESILDQTFNDFEFLIIDDGSTDRSWNILLEYSDKRIRLIRNPTNLQLVATLNRGLDLAKGKYIARMDADDVSLPQRLAKQVQFLEAHPEVGVLGTAIQLVDQCKNSILTLRYPKEFNLVCWLLHFSCPVAHPTAMVRRSVIQQVNGYSPEMKHAEDYDLWRRLSAITLISNLEDELFLYRRHEAVISTLHWAQQHENGIKISQSIISKTLRENIPISLVRLLWSRNLKTSHEILKAAQLIYRLWLATNAKIKMQPNERQLVRQDVVKRLITLAHLRLWDIRVWRVMGWGFCLDPNLVYKTMTRRLTKIAHGNVK